MEHRELQERSVDIVVTRIPKNFASDIFDIEVLFDDPHFVVAGAGSRWAQRHKIGIEELSKNPGSFLHLPFSKPC